MAGGRPTKYKGKADCDGVIECIGDRGRTLEQYCAERDVGKTTVFRWAEEHDEFRAALTRAQELSLAYWQEKLEGYMSDREANAPLVKLYFANRFKWHDRQVLTGDEDGPVKIEIVQFGKKEYSQ